jgi:ABC-2 type transport system ATP-binding protein
VIEVQNLQKQYGDVRAVEDVSFAAKPGQIFGLLGPNGAGKSTTIGCISGLLEPSAGRVKVLGHDVVLEPQAAREQLGVVPQELALYEDLSATENLRYWGAAYGLRGAELRQRVQETLAAIGLLDRAVERVKQFSGGMKRRLNLGCGIVHRPRVLLLDEPTVGVDPQSRVRLLELVREQVAGGACVLYTTHYMEEAEALCDEIAVVDHGRIIAAGSLAELRKMVGESDILRCTGHFKPEPMRAALAHLAGVEVLQADPDCLRIAAPEASRKLPELFAALAASGAEVRETTLTRPSLESLFIKLTGKQLRE